MPFVCFRPAAPAAGRMPTVILLNFFPEFYPAGLLREHDGITAGSPGPPEKTMKPTVYIVAITCWMISLAGTAAAQQDSVSPRKGFRYVPPAERSHPAKGVYVAGGSDGSILSLASVQDMGHRVRDLPRFTLVLNIGVTFNYDFSDHAGVFSGANLKNIGLITREDSLRITRRVYTLGVPAGFKFGDFDKDLFFYLGIQDDLVFNYKEKRCVDGRKTAKFQEWFSRRTPRWMPSVFAGAKLQAFNVKVQYYPGNFFRPGYLQSRPGLPAAPYENLRATLLFLSFGYSIRVDRHPGIRQR